MKHPNPKAEGWTTADIKVLMPGLRVVATRGMAHPSAPGLAIQPSTRGGKAGWAITHTESGRRIAFAKYSADARSLCLALAGLGDWTRQAKALVRDRDLQERVTLLLRALPFMETAQ